MRRTVLALTAVAALSPLAPMPSASANVCSIPCALSGVVTGSNLMPAPWIEMTLDFNGVEHYGGYVYRKPPASLQGTAYRSGSTWTFQGTASLGYRDHQIPVSGTLVQTAYGASGVLRGVYYLYGSRGAVVLTVVNGFVSGSVSAVR